MPSTSDWSDTWSDTCGSRSDHLAELAQPTVVPLDPRTLQIISAAYELTACDVMLDAEIIQSLPWSGLNLLVWLGRRHRWHASLSVNYIVAIRRVSNGGKQKG